MPLKQVKLLRTATLSADAWVSIFAPADFSATAENRLGCYLPVAGVFKNLYLTAVTALGVGADTRLTFRKNSADTAITAQIASGQTVGQDITHSVSYAIGDLVTYIQDATGAGAGATSCSFEFIATTNKVSIYGGGTGTTTLSTSANSYYPVFIDTATHSTTALVAWSMSAIAGNLIGYYFGSNAAAGAAKSYTCVIYKSTDGGVTFVKQDGTGGTVNTTGVLTGAVDINVLATFSLPVSPGDILYCEVTPAGTPTAARAHMVFAFQADNANEYTISGSSGAFTNNANRFAILNNYPGQAQSATEGNVETYGGYTAVKLDRLYLALAAAPGSGKNLNVRLRKNGSNAGASVTIADAAITGNDTSTAQIEITKTDEVCLAFTPSGTPTASNPVWAVRAKTNPGNSPNNKGRNGGSGGGGISNYGPSQLVFLNPFTFFGN